MELELIIAPDERLDTAVTKEWDFDNPQYDAKELKRRNDCSNETASRSLGYLQTK